MQEGGPTKALGSFIANAGHLDLPSTVADKAAFCLLDAIGLAAIAHEEATYVAARSLVSDLPSDYRNAARLWGDGAKVTGADATLVNAIAVHSQFHDDSDNASWTHPGSFVVPAAVAAAEIGDTSLSELLSAIAIGYSAVEWLGADERIARALIERGIRTSPTLGTIAAAAAVAAILKLDQAQATSAIGMAASITGGVLEPVGSGTDEWRLQNAHAARGGLIAAQLAAKGVLGAPAGLEGKKGLVRSLAGLDEIPPEWSNPPRIEAIVDVCAKPHATLGDNISVVLAANLARAQLDDIATIKRVTIKVWRHYAEYPGTSFKGPFQTVVQALASMTFCTAGMLVHGALEYDIPLSHREDPRILSLLPMIEIEPDDDGGPYDATVTIDLADGRQIVTEARDAPRTLLFHDRPTSRDLIERRLTSAGVSSGTGHRLADAAFGSVDGDRPISARAFLDILQTEIGEH